MTQQPVRAAAPGAESDEPVHGPGPGLVPFGVLVVGILCVAALVTWSHVLPERPMLAMPTGVWPFLLLIVAATVGEIFYVPVRHGDTWEDQTFAEIVLVGGVLLFLPAQAVVGTVLGLVLSELLFQRVPIKAMFNIGSFAISSTVMVVVYYFIDDGGDPLGIRSLIALIIAMLVWEFLNLLLLGWILHLLEGVSLRQLLRDQSWLSVLMALTAVGVATSAVALLPINALLAAFALLPAILLWFTFRANQAETKVRGASAMVAELPSVLTENTTTSARIAQAVALIRDIFGADEAILVRDGLSYRATRNQDRAVIGPSGSLIAALPTATGSPVDLGPDTLPPRWTRGVAVPLSTRDGDPAWLGLGGIAPARGIEVLLPWSRGARDQWLLADEDRSSLVNLVSSLASALQASEEAAKLTAVVDKASDGIAGFDADGSVVLWSPAMVRITGVTETTATPGGAGHPIIDLLAELRGHSTGEEAASVTITRPDGEQRELEVSVALVADDALSVLTVRDITRQRRVERMKSDFIATVSHELRTPITPIKGYAQLLAGRWDRMTPEKRTSVLGTIEDRANHLSRLVDDLLLASRVGDAENARLDVETSPADLAELVEESVAAFPALAARIEVTGRTVAIQCDRQRAVQCLSNLIGNAGKYSDPESPIRLEYGPLEGEPWGVVDVIDCGRGIPAEELDKVFDRFYRVEDPMTMTTGGSGLGLFISRELARAMQGDITVESVLGQGSRFQLRLPLLEESA